MNWYDICFIPFWWENALRQARFEDNIKSFTNGFISMWSMQILIISSPWALFESSLLIMFLIPSNKKSTSESDFSVIKGKSDGDVLPFSINEHSFLWSHWICYREKVVVYGEFFYHLKESLIEHLGIGNGWNNFFEIFLQRSNWKKFIKLYSLACKASSLSSHLDFNVLRFRRL